MHTILSLMGAVVGFGVFVCIGREFRQCCRRNSMRGELQHILEDFEPPHLPP